MFNSFVTYLASIFSCRHNLSWPRKGPRKYGKQTYYQQCVICGHNEPYTGPLF